MVSLQKKEERTKMYEVTPVHLTDEVSPVTQIVPTHKNELEQYLENSDVAVAQINAPLVAAAPEVGVMTCINQKEMAQEKVDAFLAQGAVFALRQDLRFKHDKIDVMIEQGTRIRIDDARKISDDGKSVVVDLLSVTKDDWNVEVVGFGNCRFCYWGLRFNIDALEKYFEPDVEVMQLMKRKDIFKLLFGASVGLSVILGLISSTLCAFSFVTVEHILLAVVLAIGSGLFGVLSMLWNALRMRACGAIQKRLLDVENQILQRALMEQKTPDQVD